MINQLKEITGIQDPQLLLSALNASQGDVGQAVGLLTSQPLEVRDPGDPQESKSTDETWRAQKGAKPFLETFQKMLSSVITVVGLPKDELQTAIELSLQESHNAQQEEKDLNRVLEASAEENLARMKRMKRSEGQGDMSSPADWIRQDDWPVGIRNVGNTCWFSAVIQSLFHLPVFRRLVLNYRLSERILEKCKSHSDKRNIAFMQELRCLFALMVGSTRRFVDPSAAVELLRDAFRTSEAQQSFQDVSEFSHKLLDWLEDAFQLAANGSHAADKQQNPMVQLFYGTFVTERKLEGKTLCNIEQFGQYPLQVNGFNNLYECLEGAMVEKEIESLHSDHSVASGRERWFEKLPPVLTFELSRFEFNTQLGRPEKIHKKLEFPQVIFMDRYLHKNIKQTHERRGEVKKLKEELAALQQKLECYRNYGSGPTKYPLADMLQFVLEFATTKPTNGSTAEDPRPSSPSPSLTGQPVGEAVCQDSRDTDPPEALVSSCQRTPIYKPFTQCRPPIECPPHPAPHSISEEELHFVKTCLQRWRAEVENDINELKANMDRLGQMLESMYSDNRLCQVPYRLHAVLVHEGQASAGHYWAYIYDHANQRWMKYNDINISESSWEELERDSFGGLTNASAYCLMYIDDRLPDLITDDTDDETGQVLHGLDSLPSVLRRYVGEDNRWFQQELSEWEEQISPQGESTSSAEPPQPSPEHLPQTVVEPAPQSGPPSEEPEQRASPEPEPETGDRGEHSEREEALLLQANMMLTPAMQGVILAIAKARQTFDHQGPEAGLIKAFHEEYSRLYELSQEETTPQEDPRLQHVLVYFFQNKAPKRIIERTLLEQFTDRNLSFDERAVSIMREARSKLRLIKPEDMDMDEYLQWHDDYKLFRTVFVYLLTGLEHYQNQKMREALTYLAHAGEINSSLLEKGETFAVDQTVITVFRRKCLTALNESATQLFCSGNDASVDEGVAIMDEVVIPCLHLMSRDPALSQEDQEAMEGVRSHWCSCLSRSMDDLLQVKLGEFLPRVLDSSADSVVLKDPPQVHVNQAHDLCSRLAAVMESIHKSSVVIV
uniref:ubiquitinyl hydrolase 1 n=1 Tax=Tetraodon nigroviridis TaxID=99883 RepID=H3DMV8_TETNG